MQSMKTNPTLIVHKNKGLIYVSAETGHSETLLGPG
jgi:hypothetical protein